MPKFRKYFGESLLIVLSVLLALGVNSLAAKYRTDKKKKIALASIQKEMESNQAIFKRWVKSHGQMSDKINSITSENLDSVRSIIVNDGIVNLIALFEEPTLIDRMVQKTAWETAKSTGILSEFNFEKTKRLANVYDMQSIIMEKTLPKLIEAFFSKDSLEPNSLKKSIVQMRLLFLELIGQEKVMIGFYEDGLDALKSN